MIYIFSYGSNHLDANGRSLGQCYTVVEAETAAEARQQIVDARGDKWSMCYTSKKAAGVDRWNLKEKSIDEVRIR